MKGRTRKRILTDNPPQVPPALRKNLPIGVKVSKQGAIASGKKDVMWIGQFEIDLRTLTNQSLKTMRAYWPKDDYRKLKNRKSARIGRVNRGNKRK